MTDGAEILSLPGKLRGHARRFLTRTRKARFRPDVKIGHVLLIAGPSGSGKSTFMDHLAAGRLPPAIASRIPEGAEAWLRMCGSRIYSEIDGGRGDHSKAAEIPGVVVHYDIMNPWLGGRSFEQDSDLWMVNSTSSVTVVNIHVPPEILIERLKKRLLLMQFPLRLRSTIGACLSSPVLERTADLLRKVGPLVDPGGAKKRAHEDTRARKIIAAYSGDSLADWWGTWNAYVSELPNLAGSLSLEPDERTNSFSIHSQPDETRIREAEAA